MDIKKTLTKEQKEELLNKKKQTDKLKRQKEESKKQKPSSTPRAVSPSLKNSSVNAKPNPNPKTPEERLKEYTRKKREEQKRVAEEKERVDAEQERLRTEREKKNKEQKTQRLGEEKERKNKTQKTINFEKTKRDWYGFVMDVDGVPNSRLQVSDKNRPNSKSEKNPSHYSYYLIGVLLDASKPESKIISAGYINNIDPDPYYDCANQTKLLGSLNSDAVIDAFNGETVYPVLNAFVAFVSENIFTGKKGEDEDATLLLWLNLLLNRQVSAGENTVLLKGAGTTDDKKLTVSMVQTATQKYSPSILYEVQSAKDKELAKDKKLAKYKETDPKLQPFFYVLNALTKQHPFSNCSPNNLVSSPNTTYATSAEKIDKPAEVSIKGELVKVVESLIGVLSSNPVTNTGNKSIKSSDQKYEIEFDDELDENSINLANIQKNGTLVEGGDNIFICIIAVGVDGGAIGFVKTITPVIPVESTQTSSKPAFKGGYESGLLENILYRKNKTLRRLKDHKMNI